MPKPRDPQTPHEWQEAVDLAEAYFLLESARQYGLVTGGPTVDVNRCESLLRRGRKRGYTPAPNCIDRLLAEVPTR